MKHFTSDASSVVLIADVRELAIVTHVVHYAHEGQLWAYTPYAREIDIWASLFPKILLVAPLRHQAPPGDASAFDATNITVRPMREAGGETLGAKLRQIGMLPWMLRDLWRALDSVDAIHVRCPGNIGLLGIILAPLRSKKLVAKYAGQWEGYRGEAVTVTLQRALLRSCWWRGPVTVYGGRRGDPSHVVPFFTSVMNERQIAHARAVSESRTFRAPLRILFVGRLTASKRIDAVVEAVSSISAGVVDRFTIVGDGPAREMLRALVASKQLESRVHFAGALPFDEVLNAYERHDVLVLVSATEGWPKVVAEAMAYGVVVIGADIGQLRGMLHDDRGCLVGAGDSNAVAQVLLKLVSDLERTRAISGRAAANRSNASLSDLRRELQRLLQKRWGGDERLAAK